MPEIDIGPLTDAMQDLENYSDQYRVISRTKGGKTFFDLLFRPTAGAEEVCWSTMNPGGMHGFIAGVVYCLRALSNNEDF